jgi:hypothetical protein
VGINEVRYYRGYNSCNNRELDLNSYRDYIIELFVVIGVMVYNCYKVELLVVIGFKGYRGKKVRSYIHNGI